MKFLWIPTKKIFSSIEGRQFPKHIAVLADEQSYQADIDIVIGSHRQPDAVNLTIDNYLLLEQKARIHIWVVESSFSIRKFQNIQTGKNISRIFIISPLWSTNRYFNRVYYASTGAALAASLGSFLGAAPYAFFSHSDMMGYKNNFLSFLLSKLSDDTVLASFTQRHVLPFTGGMIWDKKYIYSMDGDWLPKDRNPYRFTGFNQLQKIIPHLNWIDAGEQLIYETISRDKRAYVCASRGIKGDNFGHPLKQYGFTNQKMRSRGVPIDYASLSMERDTFRHKYPEFAENEPAWRKSFDDDGDVVFIHRGRGGRSGRRKYHRGDFLSFVQEFNLTIANETAKICDFIE